MTPNQPLFSLPPSLHFYVLLTQTLMDFPNFIRTNLALVIHLPVCFKFLSSLNDPRRKCSFKEQLLLVTAFYSEKNCLKRAHFSLVFPAHVQFCTRIVVIFFHNKQPVFSGFLEKYN